MLISFRRTALLLVLATMALTTCRKKEVEELEGPVPTASFTYVLDQTVFPVVVTFTNTSTDAFLYQWDFGDGSPLVSGKTVSHAFTLPRTYDVKLIAAGRGGTGVSPTQSIIIPSICSNAAFAVLTNCSTSGTGNWTYASQPDAIVKLAADGVTVLSSIAADTCRDDDQFIFTNSFNYTYSGGFNCGANVDGTTGFIFRPSVGLGQIVLQRNKFFIGISDSVQNKTYDIVQATPTLLRLQGTNPDGTKTVVTLAPTPPPLVLAERLLTGGSSKTWMLDDTEDNTVTVGTESASDQDYKSGQSHLPVCQFDDEYTFTVARSFIYNAKAETFAHIGANYSCVAPRSLTAPFLFGPAVGAGIAQIQLTNPTAFIGTTDSAPNHIYRIISINRKKMLLRALVNTPGNTAQMFTFKMKAKR